MNNDLIRIKRLYGEQMMKYCRKSFSTLLEKPSLLPQLLEKNFDRSKYLYEDLLKDDKLYDFKKLILSEVNEDERKPVQTDKTPEELMLEVGYTLFECTSERDINYFMPYYEDKEILCTFTEDRLDTNYVYFAVKEDAHRLKRADFKNPNKHDEYGTSVISIQFSKDQSRTLSIKNRYNHTVSNSDSTFSNNLDYIVPGLTYSFEKHKKMKQTRITTFDLKDYIKGPDQRYYRLNHKISDIYYCANNVIIQGNKVTRYPKEKYIVFDYFILDIRDKKITLYDYINVDTFDYTFRNIVNIDIRNKDYGKEITISQNEKEDVVIRLNKHNNIIYLKDINQKELHDDYLLYLRFIKEIDMPNVEIVGENFLYSAMAISKVNLPNLKIAGKSFMRHAFKLEEISLPNLKEVEDRFIEFGYNLETVSCPNITEIGEDFLANYAHKNKFLETLNLSKTSKTKVKEKTRKRRD